MPVVKFYAGLRKVAGVKEMTVPGRNIRLVLETLAIEIPGMRAFFPDGERARVIISLNGHTLDLQTALDIPVSEQDEIAIFPPIAGG